MIEKNIENYKPGVRKFGIINWVGAKHLYIKEVNRFLIVWSQTLFAPLITTVLFYMVESAIQSMNSAWNEIPGTLIRIATLGSVS